MKKLMVISGVLLVVSLLVLFSCSPAFIGTDVAVEKGAPEPMPASIPAPTPTPAPRPMPPVEEVSVERVAGVLSPAEDRMIVRAGDMSLVVDDVPLTLDRITELADG